MRYGLATVATIMFCFFSAPSLASAQELDRSLFQPSSLVSVETAKKKMKQVYLEGGNNRTLHCGCVFDKLKQVYPSLCQYSERKAGLRDKRRTLDWTHIMPASVFAADLRCWKQPVCTLEGKKPYKGYRCCEAMSPRFKRMEADMHNLIPVVAQPSSDTDDEPALVPYGGMDEYRFCSLKGDDSLQPREGARGDIARAWFYMSIQYKVPLPDTQEDVLREWHLADPPDGWEEKKNSLLEVIQGNRNPFIDQPELVERVRNF